MLRRSRIMVYVRPSVAEFNHFVHGSYPAGSSQFLVIRSGNGPTHSLNSLGEVHDCQYEELARTEEAQCSRYKIWWRSEEHTSELQSRENLVCRLLLEKKKYENVY